jgi:hypothetical protein
MIVLGNSLRNFIVRCIPPFNGRRSICVCLIRDIEWLKLYGLAIFPIHKHILNTLRSQIFELVIKVLNHYSSHRFCSSYNENELVFPYVDLF